ncbi:MAG: phage holin family protein [Candidatus Faecousia sp.]|nr:phage holin family protein [Candidatus Faecousia sp.]
MEYLGFASVAAITVICFLAAEAVKLTPLDNKWLPVICGVLGGILGVVGQRVMPDFPADNILTAIAVGIVSGLAATGAHQIYKQQTQKGAHEK